VHQSWKAINILPDLCDMNSVRTGWSVVLLLSWLLPCHARLALGQTSGNKRQLASTNEAYATLLYGDAFLLAVRVLGQSLTDTGSTRCEI
jgi:hypothetical protein